jgi:hypothetical protein
MKKLAWPLLAALIFAGCATTPHAATIKKDIPPAPQGQAAVFGRVVLLNTVNKVSMPADDLEASVYLRDDDAKKTYKICTIASGDFGVYLPPGAYRAVKIETQGYKFVTDLNVAVPDGQRAVYTGTIILDGEPDGVIPGTVNSAIVHSAKRLFLGKADTRFIYQVKDDQAEFEAGLKRAAPAADVKFTKALFEPAGGVAAGYYPDKLNRMQGMEETLKASSSVIEDTVGGTIIALPYFLNPLAFIGLPL